MYEFTYLYVCTHVLLGLECGSGDTSNSSAIWQAVRQTKDQVPAQDYRMQTQRRWAQPSCFTSSPGVLMNPMRGEVREPLLKSVDSYPLSCQAPTPHHIHHPNFVACPDLAGPPRYCQIQPHRHAPGAPLTLSPIRYLGLIQVPPI